MQIAINTISLTSLLTITQLSAANEGRFVNLSTRALVEMGEEVMIGGFIIENGARQVLIQAVGPELANRGIANALADPVLTVTNTTDSENPIELMVNDNWEDSQGQLVSELWGGNPNLAAGSLSSAAVLTLDPGNYTAKVEGKDGTTGVAIVEVYGIDSAGAEGQFVNISTRALVETGEEVMIGGFIIQDGARQVLIQAKGPELANAGISSALADPLLTVIQTGEGEPPRAVLDPPIELMVNDNWEESQGQLVSDLWGGSPNLTAGSLSAAAVLTLHPGEYTAKVEGKDGTTGVAIVEVYGIDSPDTGSPDREALTALYNGTDGANWTNNENWLTDAPLDQWQGVGVDQDSRVIELNLSGNGLTGPLPAELANLSNLERLHLNNNRLSGPIPSELGQLVKLEALKLFENQLSGEIPTQLGNLANLRSLWLYDNQLSGEIPVELGQLANLVELYLSENQLSGEILPQLGQLANLQYLHLNGNELSGAIPAELGNFVNLIELDLSNNRLSGSIPAEFGQLVNLESLNLNDNELGGAIPSELSKLPLLRLFSYVNTDLCVPADATLLAWLGEIQSLIGAEVTCPPDLEALEVLYNATEGANWTDRGNWLTDAPLGDWHGVTTDDAGRVSGLSLVDNNLSGTIPAELGELTELRILNLEINHLEGEIPQQIENLTGLEMLSLTNNRLRGGIPSEIASLTRLRTLALSWNVLEGEIPPELGNLVNLEFLDLNRSFLSGPIPSEIRGLTQLRTLALAENNLEGEIPAELGNLANLEFLELSGNLLTGTIPPELGNLAKLRSLNLNDNQLSGLIPGNLLALTGLDYFRFWPNEGLCAPGTIAFVEWLGRIENVDGLSCNEADIAALKSLYAVTGGADWTNAEGWLDGAALERWHGVTADSLGRVVELDLSRNGLAGRLPATIGQLDRMTSLRIGGNALAGALPWSLSSLPLRELRYADTDLCALAITEFRTWLSTIPSHEGTGNECVLSEREVLTIIYEATDGPNWFFSDNWLTEAPLGEWHGIEVDEAGNVVKIDLAGNNLVGRIPPEMGLLGELDHLNLSYNYLPGEIPPELGRLTGLLELDLTGIGLHGEIPPEVGLLRELDHLFLAHNDLTGSIPPELGSSGSLVGLRLNNNRLEGPLPATLSSQVGLRHLNLSYNMLSGALPASLGQLRSLYELPLNNNRFSGAVPAEFGDPPEMYRLYLFGNPELTGPLPHNLTNGRITQFLAHGTGLCAPDTPAFREWLEGMYFQRIPLCNWAETSAYLTQATQSREYPVPLVAGESALLRVFVTSGQETSETLPPVRATFFVDGSEVHVAEIPAGPEAIPTEVREGDLGLSANAEIPGSVIRPGLEMVVEIDPGGTVDPVLGLQRRFPVEGRKAVDVRVMPPLELTLVPFIWSGSNHRATAELVQELHPGHELFWHTNHLLPVGAIELIKHDPVLVDSNNPFDLLEMTKQIRTVEGGDGYWMGLLLRDASTGISVAFQSGKVSFVQPYEATTIAHELGHNLSLHHAPCDVRENLDPFFPDPTGRIESWGYDPRNAGSLVPPVLPDLMSYCRPQWIGEYNFSKAADYRIEDEGAPSATLAASKSLLVSGRVEADSTLHIDPAFVIDAPPVLPDGSGPYALTGQSEDGSQLFSLAFDMTQIADGDGRSSFMFALPAKPEWAGALASITLKGPGGSAVLDGESDLPMKILRNPQTGQVHGILRDSPLEAAVAVDGAEQEPQEPGFEELFSRGIPDAAAWLDRS